MDTSMVSHTFPPVADETSEILILGSFPSVKSRENQFYYGHPQNRFWKMLAGVYDEPVPEQIPEKKAFLLRHHLALLDVIASCEITGSSDSSIRKVTVNELDQLLQTAPIRKILLNGGKAAELFERHCRPVKAQIEQRAGSIEKMPSTSPANAAWRLERLIEVWREALGR